MWLLFAVAGSIINLALYVMPVVMAIAAYVAFSAGRRDLGRQRILICAVLTVLLGLLYVQQIPGYLLACAEKHGQVIDDDTHQGIPNSFVVVDSYVSTGGPMTEHSGSRREYRLIVRTDSNGLYTLPSQWSKASLDLAWFGVKVERDFKVEAFAPGYVYTEDTCCIDRIAQGFARLRKSPASRWRNFGLTMDPILMSKYDLPPQAVNYLFSLVDEVLDSGNEEARTQKALNQALYEFFLAKTCSGDSLSKIASYPAGRLVRLSPHWHEGTKRLATLEPEAFEIMKSGLVHWKDEQSHPFFFLGSICSAMEVAGESQ